MRGHAESVTYSAPALVTGRSHSCVRNAKEAAGRHAAALGS